MSIWKVWSTDNPEQPVCYVEAPNDGRAIIHAYSHEEAEEFRQYLLITLQAEEVTDLPRLTMRALRESKRCVPFCAVCGLSIFASDGIDLSKEPFVFCSDECFREWETTRTPYVGDDQETMICLYTDV